MTRRSQSSSRWLQEHFNEPYVRRAQAGGWRSRAVFKLDLGAAPGAWSPYAVTQAGPKGRVIASDILPMAGRVLKPGGAALIKVFQGAGFQELVAASRRQLNYVRFIKPAASRARSVETYLVASGLRLV